MQSINKQVTKRKLRNPIHNPTPEQTKRKLRNPIHNPTSEQINESDKEGQNCRRCQTFVSDGDEYVSEGDHNAYCQTCYDQIVHYCGIHLKCELERGDPNDDNELYCPKCEECEECMVCGDELTHGEDGLECDRCERDTEEWLKEKENK